MAEHYVWIKQFHIGMAYLTVTLFALRGLYRLIGGERVSLRLRKVTDRISYGVDTLLLVMGILLLVILQLDPLSVAWLSSKLGLLVAYVILGVFAFRNRLPLAARWLAFALALGCWVLMYKTARLHLPLWMW
ncbi:MAG: SirB2 family protein [Gammaproteobacteria bacterium]|nr:SirB2 family protein [Gammaproteobacteria bacterium]